MGYFLKRLEIHTAFQSSWPRDLCDTCMWVLEYSVYAAPVLGNACDVGFLCGNVMQDCLLYESLQIYTMGIFTGIPYKFCIYHHLVVSFHFLSV